MTNNLCVIHHYYWLWDYNSERERKRERIKTTTMSNGDKNKITSVCYQCCESSLRAEIENKHRIFKESLLEEVRLTQTRRKEINSW